jgi:Tfp pilus assembly protein PilF
MAQIVNGLATTPNYHTQSMIYTHLAEKGTAAMEEKLKPYSRYVARYAKSSELNTYGYVLLSEKKFEEALLVFRINAMAFPHKPNVFDSLAEAYLKSGNKELAIENYKKVLELKPDDEQAKKELAKLESQS